MYQIDKIYDYIFENSKDYTKDKLLTTKGFTAEEIANNLNLLRNNVSRELNALCRQNKIIKIKSRPVYYFPRNSFEKLLEISLSDDIHEIQDLNKLLKKKEQATMDKSPFSHLIGAETSLKNQIEQAKAALLYPPNGLHTLVIGSTGVGKSLFVNMMYEYAKYINKLPDGAPFIVFNCADYANNPQLLLSHIFGHIKGAFTGADKETSGIIGKANGGILFLDEIHRLPPEGQEMIFYFMDTGSYNKLGETERNHHANVLLIGATTEDPSSSLLNTFIRRIPITISIPDFNERPLEDQLKLVEFLISKEAKRINKPIEISAEAIKAFIGSTNYGNVGQLKSNIQLACAKGFLNSMNTKDHLSITLEMLPSKIKSGLITYSPKANENSKLWSIIPSTVVITPTQNDFSIPCDSYEPSFNIYDIIKDKVSILKSEGMADTEIQNFISTDINVHLKQLYDRFKNDFHRRNGLLKIVDEDIIKFAEKMKNLAEEALNKRLNEKFIYAISLHFSALFTRIKSNEYVSTDNFKAPYCYNTKEYEIAGEIYNLLQTEFNIIIPNVEIEYLALLLISIQETTIEKQVAIIVAAHGRSTASSMVNVAKELLEAVNITAIDMPLDITPQEILEEVISTVKKVNQGKGVLLLVDMGSLTTFSEVITKRTGILTKTIDMVSTPLVLEAVRKSSITDTDLLSVYSYLTTNFRGYSPSLNTINSEGVIVTVCSTGKGAAIKLKNLVSNVLKDIPDNNISIIPVGVKGLKNSINDISQNNKIIAVVGIVNPNMGYPFISIEDIIDGTGENKIKSLINNTTIIENPHNKSIVLDTLCMDSLTELITFLNPNKIYPLLLDYIISLEKTLKISFNNPFKIKLIVHVGCLLERIVLKDTLPYPNKEKSFNKTLITGLKNSAEIFTNTLSLTIPDDELYYLADIIEEYEY